MGELLRITKITYIIVIPIHIIAILIRIILINNLIISDLIIIGVWLIVNYAFGFFAVIFANACFESKHTTIKILGILPLSTILLGISFIAGIPGVLIGTLAPKTY